MFDRITVQNNGKRIYDIVLEASFSHLGEEVSQLQVEKRKLCIVTDSNVAPLYLEAVEAQLQPYCKKVDSFVFPAGEGQKNLDTVVCHFPFSSLTEHKLLRLVDIVSFQIRLEN